MSRIFDALRKAEQEPNPLVRQERPLVVESGVRPRDRRVLEREFSSLSSAIQSYFPKATTGKVILVVGCSEREGVTYVTANLGRMLASTAGAPVLCLDANFHDPGLSRVFQTHDGLGLADVYDNGRPRDLSSILQPGDTNNLYVLGTGKRRVSPVSFFDSSEFEALLAALRRTFRFVVVDGAPMLKHPDAIHLAGRVDGVVVVVRYKHLKREVIRKGIEMIESINAPILGAVLNRRKFAIPTLIYRLIT
jgi:capsular exopolysaccharide synthesis family protein